MSPTRAPVSALAPAEIERGMRLSVIDGVFLALMFGFGGEGYFVLDVIRLAGTRHEQGLFVLRLLHHGRVAAGGRRAGGARRRKPLVVGAALGQAATLFTLAACDYLGGTSPGLLIAVACVHQVFGQAHNTGWASWFGDLVPAATRGRTFARRNRWIYVVTCLGLAAGGGLLQLLEPAPESDGAGRGFALVFALAGCARLVSAWLLAASPEPAFRGVPPPVRVLRFLRTERGSGIGRMLLSTAALYFTVYVASPYFLPYMKDELHFGYAEVQAAQIAVVLFKVLFVPLWGRAIDEFGARAVFGLTSVFLALVPIPWLWAGGLGWVLCAQSFSGFSWGGYEVSLFALALERAPKRVRPHVFAVQSLLNGSAQILGSQAGALVASLASNRMRVVFAASLALRFAMALALRRTVSIAPDERRIGHGALLARSIGLGGGRRARAPAGAAAAETGPRLPAGPV
jgi:hypothetical protein